MSDEVSNIEDRYRRRSNATKDASHSQYVKYMVREREEHYLNILRNQWGTLDDLKMLEIGAGGGANLNFFKKAGFYPSHIFANELIDIRVEELRGQHQDVQVIPGNALEIDPEYDAFFDLIFQSSVFTSILDPSFKQQLAHKMWKMLKPGGIVLWYDFQYNNPKNKDVKGVKRKEIANMFKKSSSIDFKKVTLAPPIGRRVGRMYPFFNAFPFLRTHIIAVIRK